MSLVKTWYTPEEAESKFGVNKSLLDWVEDGLVRCEREGGKVARVNIDDVQLEVETMVRSRGRKLTLGGTDFRRGGGRRRHRRRATAVALLGRAPGLRLVLLEKEARLAAHQTGHNSGVIHSGLYYRPGSLKARNCVQRPRGPLRFCDEQGHRPRALRQGGGRHPRGGTAGPRRAGAPGPGKRSGGTCSVSTARSCGISSRMWPGSPACMCPETGIVDYVRVTEALARRRSARPAGRSASGSACRPIRRQRKASRLRHPGRSCALPLSGQLRRAALRPGRPDGRVRARRADHPLPRRVLPAEPRAGANWCETSSTRCPTRPFPFSAFTSPA